MLAAEVAATGVEGCAPTTACAACPHALTCGCSRFSFFFACGMSFYQEIAKLRAARRLWARMVKEK